MVDTDLETSATADDGVRVFFSVQIEAFSVSCAPCINKGWHLFMVIQAVDLQETVYCTTDY